MMYLVGLIIAIVIGAILMLSSTNSVNPESLAVRSGVSELRASMMGVQSSLDSYVMAQGSTPEIDEWSETLYPTYGPAPAVTLSGTWEYAQSAEGMFVCFSSTQEPRLVKIFEHLSSVNPSQYRQGVDCGDAGGLVAGEPAVLSYQLRGG